jgi:hypothetical protein
MIGKELPPRRYPSTEVGLDGERVLARLMNNLGTHAVTHGNGSGK